MVSRAQHVEEAEHYIALYDNDVLEREEDIILALDYKWFRLNTLYRIKDVNGKNIPFVPNYAQKNRFLSDHSRVLILKARQLGFTTFEMIDALDDCLFNDHFKAGCIAHTLDDSKDIYLNKIKFAYEQLTDSSWIDIFDDIGLDFPLPRYDKGESYIFSNGSQIGVSVGYRGGTLQRLHVSEFGKICAKFPDKAQEIVTGAFEAVGINGRIAVESTAEGREGYFFELSQHAQRMQKEDKRLTPLDFDFLFFPWHENKAYTIDPDGVVITRDDRNYFDKLETKHGITTTKAQRAWYVKKKDILGDDVFREHPSIAAEAFDQSVKGSYYERQMSIVRRRGQIRSVPYDERLPVYTFFDLGRNDNTAIWFMQYAFNQYRLIDYYENSGESFQFYLRHLRREYNYIYSTMYLPHDAEVTDYTNDHNKKRKQIAMDAGFAVRVVPRVPDKMEAIQAVRQLLPLCWFDESNCARGIACLDSFRKERNIHGEYKDTPVRDWAKHGADAFEQLARGFNENADGDYDSYEPEVA